MTNDKTERKDRQVWLGPRITSDNGLELRGIVIEGRVGSFQAGTRYGPKGSTMPELGPEAFLRTDRFSNKDKAIEVAKGDVQETLRGCNAHARAEKLLEKVSKPGRATSVKSRSQSRSIDR